MADPTEFERLTQALNRQAHCLDSLAETEELQRQRWDLLAQVVEDAAWQFTSMRIDAVEESLRDQGPPFWLSLVLGVGITMIVPTSFLTASFIGAFTKYTQKLVTVADRKLLETLSKTWEIETKAWKYDLWAKLPGHIQLTEEMVARYAKSWEPELANLMAGTAQTLGQMGTKFVFEQDRRRKAFSRTAAPVVVVKRALLRWVEAQIRCEGVARANLRRRIRDLFDIAISPKPGKEAKAKEEEAKKAGRPVRALPKTNKEALQQLTKLSEEIAPTTWETLPNPAVEDLWEIQRNIESMIWATTYDFTPIKEGIQFPIEEVPGKSGSEAFKSRGLVRVPLAAPLPDALWKRLTSRYIDPDENKSYKEVGNLDRLGTKAKPVLTDKQKLFGPEVRLSFYFSKVLYPQLRDKNSGFAKKFSQVSSVTSTKSAKSS
jgi:hypothetical protein